MFTVYQKAVEGLGLIAFLQVHNISLRMLHITKQSRFQKPFVVRLQQVLRETGIGISFFGAVAKPKVLSPADYGKILPSGSKPSL